MPSPSPPPVLAVGPWCMALVTCVMKDSLVSAFSNELQEPEGERRSVRLIDGPLMGMRYKTSEREREREGRTWNTTEHNCHC